MRQLLKPSRFSSARRLRTMTGSGDVLRIQAVYFSGYHSQWPSRTRTWTSTPAEIRPSCRRTVSGLPQVSIGRRGRRSEKGVAPTPPIPPVIVDMDVFRQHLQRAADDGLRPSRSRRRAPRRQVLPKRWDICAGVIPNNEMIGTGMARASE